MKNIHVLPTDKPSRLFKFANELHLDTIPKDYYKKYNINITSDEEIKEGEKCITFGSDKCKGQLDTFQSNVMYSRKPQKIILTTDPDLITDGVQAIDDEFLQWYVKNPSCEYVEVNEKLIIIQDKPLVQHQGNKPIVVPHRINYKIIIPKEEPKPIHQQIIDIVGGEDRFKEIAGIKPKQEAFEEIVKTKAFEFKVDYKPFETDLDYREYAEYGFEKGFIEGVKWQAERMFSDEEVIAIVEKSRETGLTAEYLLLTEQFKKK